MHYSWGVFGINDQLGTLNKITRSVVTSAATEVQTGESIGLVLPVHHPDPPFFGRDPYVHEIFATGRSGFDDKLDNFYLQGSSQWDGFRHVKAREFGLYGGFTEVPQPLEPTLGIQAWSERGIVTRGVLIDVARFMPPFDPFEETRVSAADIRAIAEQENVEIRPGDALFFRFGFSAAYKALDLAGRTSLASRTVACWAGLDAAESMAEALWDWGVSAVGGDNPSLECSPGSAAIGSLHRRLLPMLGMPIAEFLDLDALAEASAGDGRYSFMLAAQPLPVVGGVGSPANAVAIR